MRYNLLGRTGLFVSELCLGTMTFGGVGGIWESVGGLQQQAADDLVKTAIDAGINIVDTANVYAQGVSEQITGQAIRNLGIRREDVIIATKFMGPMMGPNGAPGRNSIGTSRGHMLDSVHASLKRLQVDHIDLYQIHGFDDLTPMEETLRALDDVVRQGKVRYIGVSNWAAWQIAKALGISREEGLARFASLQAYYTIAGRDLERELVPMMQSEGVGLMVWSPLAGGFLSGKFTREGAKTNDSRRVVFDFPPVDKERAYDVIDTIKPIADRHGVSIARVALAWLLARKGVMSVIVGAKTIEQLDDNLAAVKLELSVEDLAELDRASAPRPEYPGWMIARQSEQRAPAPKV